MSYSKTFAFSNRFDKWTTRYSFTPTCYGSVDNYFVSANNGKVWEHDVNPKRCNFYEEAHGCGLTVASNQDPSAVKVFNSLSLETNSSKWEAKVKANEEKEIQSGSVQQDDWKNKEGFLYADMPKSVNNSTSSISFAGGNASPLGVLNTFPPVADLLGQGVTAFTFKISVHPSGVSLATGDKCDIIFDIDGELKNFLGTELVPTDISGQSQGLLPSGGLNELELVAVEGSVDAIESTPKSILTVKYKNLLGTPFTAVSLFNLLTLLKDAFKESVFVVSPANINGDNIRGSYAKMELSDDSEEAVQINAVNVDYQFSKLDARLTQNT